MDEPKGKKFREWVAIVLSALAIIVAGLSWFFSNNVSQKALDNSKTFGGITAEVQWSNLLNSYHDIDEEIKEWEQGRNFEKVDVVVKSYEELEEALKLIKPPENIKRLYIRRFENYQSLENVAKLYGPVKDRLRRIDFTLPAAPLLPKATISGVSIGGGSAQ